MVGNAVAATNTKYLLVKLTTLRKINTFTAALLFFILFLNITDGSSSSIHNGAIEHDEHQYQFTSSNPKCERIKIDMCKDIPYNMTIYPNLLKHGKQEEAEMDIKQYEMLVKVQCSLDFKFFLCTLFAPVCTILNEPIPPCRHLCLSAKNGCETLMRKFGYQWPEIFDCEKMPTSKDGMCVGENDNNENEQDKTRQSEKIIDKIAKNKKNELECPHAIKVISTTRHILTIGNHTLEQCSLPCQNDGLVPTFFNANIRHYLRLWTGAWAVTCCVCCLFTIITFLIDLDRFEFPEKAILYMACCYLLVSATYMIGLVAEDGLSCAVQSPTKQSLVTQGNENFWCTGLAIAHFYFTSTGALWWLLLCFSWFLVTTLKWGEAPVGHVFSSYFNVIAWLLPAIGVVILFVSGGIDGDVFSGICAVGNLQPYFTLQMIVFPQAIVIVIGIVFFACGFISIMRIRSYIKGNRFIANKHAEASDKLSRLMLRISCFSLLYVLPAAVGLYCTYYQSRNMHQWLTNWYSTRCLHAQRAVFGFTQPREQCPIGETIEMNNQPIPLLFFLKYMSNFSVGIACTVWTLNGKTVSSFLDFFSRLVLCGSRHRLTRVPTQVH